MTTRTARVLAASVLASALTVAVLPGTAVALPPNADPHFVQVDAGRFNHAVLGLTDDGTVYSWGVGFYGELGEGTSVIEKLTPSPIALPALAAGDRVIQVSVGSEHALALTEQGTVLAWGRNESGQLGLGDTATRGTPTIVPTSAFPGLSTARIVAISASGADHSLALSSSGQVFAWGWNGFGQVGDNSVSDRWSPVRVINNSATSVSAGNGYSFAVTSAGVYSWGINLYGQLGNGTTSARLVPSSTAAFPGLASGEQIVEVAAGGDHVLARGSHGTVYSWGDDGYGQLGLGAGDDSRTAPAIVTVPGLASGDTVESVDAGEGYSLARTAAGSLYTWGFNSDGQLALGDLADRDSPTPVTAFPAVLDDAPIAHASAGHDGAVIVSATGGVYGSGRFGGLLGDETASDYPVSTFSNIRLGDLAGSASLSAAPLAGTPVSANTTGWNAGAVLSYQWQRGGSDIGGATGSSYTPVVGDLGQQLRVVVTATAENFATGTTTSTAATVAAAAPDIQTLSLPPATAGDVLSIPIVTTGTGPLYYSGVTLPSGLSIGTTTGVISGTLTVVGSYTVQIQVSSDYGVDNGYFTLSVVPGATTRLTLLPSTTTPTQGDTIDVTVVGYDAYDNEVGNLTSETVFVSDVSTDLVVGNAITFPQASPHTITATARGVSESVVIQVTPLRGSLSGTGAADTGEVAAVAILALVLGTVLLGAGGLTVTRMRLRSGVARSRRSA
ncbi:MAG: putative Ig domain-containing protein [Cryobacterium sp.]|nr:putative Ig domain-containing protein [Cryobacterium sp.]